MLVAGLLVAGFLPTLRDGHLLDDMATYLQAAERLQQGDPIYGSYPGDLIPYKYAPWFAALWIPATWLPEWVVGTAWLAALGACTTWLLWRAPWWIAMLTGTFVSWGAAIGNAAPLLFVVLAIAIPTRAVGVAIGVVASLKAFPVLLVIPLLMQHRWRQALLAVLVVGALTAPMLAFDLSGYQVSSEGPHSIFNVLGPLAWVASVVVSLAIAFSRPSWRTAGLAVFMANPRFQWYDVGYLLIGTDRRSKPPRTRRSSDDADAPRRSP